MYITWMKNITAILLVLVISTTGIPCFLVEDASHDGTVDLQDVILQVQDFRSLLTVQPPLVSVSKKCSTPCPRWLA